MHKLNVRKRPELAEARRVDALVMRAHVSPWWSSRFVLPTLLGCGALLGLGIVPQTSFAVIPLIVAPLLGASLILGVRARNALRQEQVFEVWTNYVVLDDLRLPYASLDLVSLERGAVFSHSLSRFWWKEWVLSLNWSTAGHLVVDSTIADHNRVIDAILAQVPARRLEGVDRERVRKARSSEPNTASIP
ncbi:MAG: hypothetical protein ABI577_10530 [bacterium]